MFLQIRKTKLESKTYRIFFRLLESSINLHKYYWGAGRPKLTWKKLTERDCREWKLTTVDPQERSTLRSGVRSSMRAASQLPEKGPTDVDDAPAPAR